jgi:cobalt-zinc-cadmium efflux system outer membrane protein
MRYRRIVVALGLAVCIPLETSAQTTLQSSTEVLVRAREQAPQIVSARLALDEVRARLAAAGLRLQQNPEIELALGNRNGDIDRSTDLELGVSQRFEPRSRRVARLSGVNAAIAVASADLDETVRVVQREAALAYYRALHANERERLWATVEQLAAGVEQSADRRFRVGDIPVLELNLARASRARARAERQGASAAEAAAVGELQQLLRLDGAVAVSGSLNLAADVDRTDLVSLALQRPELRRLEAAVREAEAEVQLGRSFQRREYGVGTRYEREGADRVFFGGITVTLPVFANGQEFRAVGSARAARLRAELEASQTRVQIEVRSKLLAYERSVAGLRILQTDALPGLDENETLTNRSFEVGQIGLTDLLLIRREILDTRFQYLDALLDAALARTELLASAGALR